MLKIEGIKLPVGRGEDPLRERVRKLLRLRNAGDLLSLTLLRRSIDAREDAYQEVMRRLMGD